VKSPITDDVETIIVRKWTLQGSSFVGACSDIHFAKVIA